MMKYKALAIAPFVIILVLIVIFYLTGLYHQLSFETIKHQHEQWKLFVLHHPFLSVFYFVGIYIVSVVLVIPDSTLLTLLSGFLFPLPLAILYTSISETIGATLFFLAARLAYTKTIEKKEGYFLHRLQKKFQENQASYLLFLRFSHLLPFWLVSFSAGIFHVRTATFIWTTLVGVIPLTYVIAQSGSSLSIYLEAHEHFSWNGIFTTELKLGLIALGCIALLPLAYKKWVMRRGK
jgi:uncharacterized membrane protein YdjX (TVP38/TMEM64 family)